MEYLIVCEDTEKCFTINTKGDFDLKNFQELIDTLLMHPNLCFGMNSVFDYRESEFCHVSPPNLRDASLHHKRKIMISGCAKSALAMKNDMNYGIGRRMCQGYMVGDDTEFKIFTDFDKAHEWACS